MSNLLPITSAQRIARFGAFRYHSDPTPSNPEHIIIEGGWAERNITAVHIPQLLVLGRPRMVFVNHLAAEPMLNLFAAWQAAGLMPLVLEWNGSWVPRFKRQHGTPEERKARCRNLGPQHLSNHAWGTAFDINASLNPLGHSYLPDGARGTTHPLVAVANEHGFFCGGDFHSRPDPMHFELAGRAPDDAGDGRVLVGVVELQDAERLLGTADEHDGLWGRRTAAGWTAAAARLGVDPGYEYVRGVGVKLAASAWRAVQRGGK